MSTLARGTFVNLGARVAAIALGVTVTVLTARIGADAQGQFALFTSIETLLLALFSGFGVALARRVSRLGEHPQAVIGAASRACLGLGAVCAVALVGLASLSTGTYASLWILALSAPVLLLPANLSGVWLGQGRMGPIGVVTVAVPLLTLLFFALFWAFDPRLAPDKIVAMLVSWALSRAFVGLAALGRFRSAALGSPDWQSLRHDLPFIATIGLTNLIGLLNYRADLFLVEYFVGLAPTGEYSIAVMLAELLWLLSSALTQAAYARIGTQDRDAATRFVVRIAHANLIALALAAPLLYVVAKIALSPLIGPGYPDVPHLLLALLPGVLGYGAASPLSAYFTNHVGRPHVPALVAGVSLVINVACCVVLIPRIGALGGALATSVSYLLSVALMMALFARHAGLRARDLATPDLREMVRQLREALSVPWWRGT